jgi:proteasome lid subunit RPN8/RPN11
MIKVLKMQPEHWQAMHEHVASMTPVEACGMLAGKEDRVENVLLVRNAEQSPVRFRMDPLEQINALEWIDANGLDLLGIFHSHPSGPETVSPTDIAEAAYEVVHLIWFRTGGTWSARGFWIEKDQVTEVELQVIPG